MIIHDKRQCGPKKVCVQIQALSLPKTVFTHDSALRSHNTPAGELVLCS